MISFAMEHPVATFFIVWVLAETLRSMVVRCTRAVMVSKHGWPPAHLDADGDWKPEQDHG